MGTVVDDFAAFVIRMPWLHRLACFRDDVYVSSPCFTSLLLTGRHRHSVFLILLYQRWIYRVDPNRVNEYGQTIEGKVEPVGETKDEEESKKESKKDK